MELAREDRITDTSFNEEFIISNDKEPSKPTERKAPFDQLISGADIQINGNIDKRIASDRKIQQVQIKRDQQNNQRSSPASRQGENSRVVSAEKGVIVYQETGSLQKQQEGIIDPETRTTKKSAFRIHFSTGKKTRKDLGIESEQSAKQRQKIQENIKIPIQFEQQQQGSPQRYNIARPFSVECCRKPNKTLRQSPHIKVSKGNSSFVLQDQENKLRQTSYPFQSVQQNTALKLLNNCLERSQREGSKSAEQRCRSTLSFSPVLSKKQKVPEFRTQALVDLRKQVNEARGELEFEKKRTSEIMSMLSSMRQRVFGKIDKATLSNSQSEHEAEINFIESRIRTIKKRMKDKRIELQDKEVDENLEAEKEQQERFQALVELQRALQASKKELSRLQRENKVLQEERDTFEERAKDESRLAELKEMEVNRLRSDIQQLNGNQLQYMSLKLEVQKKKKELDFKLAEFDKIRQENINLKLHTGQPSSASKPQQQQQQGRQSIQHINDLRLNEITKERDGLIRENERLKIENEFLKGNNNSNNVMKQGKNEIMNLQTNAQDKRMNATDKDFGEFRRGRDNSFGNKGQNRFEMDNMRNSGNQNSSYQNTNQFYESQQDQQNRFNDSFNQLQGFYQQPEQSQQNQEQNSQLFRPKYQEQQQNKPYQLNQQQLNQPQYEQRSENKQQQYQQQQQQQQQRSPPKDQMKRQTTEDILRQQEEYKYQIDELNAKVKELQKGNAGEIQRLRNECGNLQRENERQRVFYEQQIDDMKYQMSQETRQSQSNFGNHGVQRGFSEGRRGKKEW